jgi:hypothetical protein
LKIFYDTEFLEDGKTIELISIGMVAEDGRELYLVNEAIEHQPLYDRICKHDWLMANVVPHLPLRTGTHSKPYKLPEAQFKGHFLLDSRDNRVVSRRYIRNAVRDFVLSTAEPELWAYYGAYDHVVLAQLFGRMIDLPTGVPMWTNDLKQEVERRGNPSLPEQESAEHDALADARWVRDAYAWLAAS